MPLTAVTSAVTSPFGDQRNKDGILLEKGPDSGAEYDADLLAMTQALNKRFKRLYKKYNIAGRTSDGKHLAVVTSPDGLYLAFCRSIDGVLAKLDPQSRAAVEGILKQATDMATVSTTLGATGKTVLSPDFSRMRPGPL
jgi:hypothetical protein